MPHLEVQFGLSLTAIDSGLESGEQVVTSGTFKLRSGTAVQVNNSVQPSNNPVPRPEER